MGTENLETGAKWTRLFRRLPEQDLRKLLMHARIRAAEVVLAPYLLVSTTCTIGQDRLGTSLAQVSDR